MLLNIYCISLKFCIVKSFVMYCLNIENYFYFNLSHQIRNNFTGKFDDYIIIGNCEIFILYFRIEKFQNTALG